MEKEKKEARQAGCREAGQQQQQQPQPQRQQQEHEQEEEEAQARARGDLEQQHDVEEVVEVDKGGDE